MLISLTSALGKHLRLRCAESPKRAPKLATQKTFTREIEKDGKLK
jgi:hypothetical protein